MLKALKVVMIIYGVLGILWGLAFIFIPNQLGANLGFPQGPAYVSYMLALLGSSFIAASVFILAAARDPLQNVVWVKFAILLSGLSAVTALYSIIVGSVNFAQAGTGLITDALFALVFLALYPRRGASPAPSP